MSQKIHWTLGLPGSGKSTKAKEMVDKSQGKLKRVNKDDLRSMIDNYAFDKTFRKSNESFILAMRDSLIENALNAGLSVICDDTNFGDKHPLRFAQLALEYTKRSGKPCEVVKIDCTDVPYDECIRRDAARGDKKVGAGVIMRMYEQFLHDPANPLPVIPQKTWSKRPVLPVYKPPVDGLPKAIVIDLDGTCADISVRESMGLMFDASRCDELDTPNEAVLLVINSIYTATSNRIIFMSGRMNKDREATLRFLTGKCALPPAIFELHMRATGDMRKDSIVKKELFDKYIHGKYNPVLWLDDRDQVVDFVRKELGVPCFQVNYGNF